MLLLFIVIQKRKKVNISTKKFQVVFEKIDNLRKIGYNRDMEKSKLAIIGGGAAGLILANSLPNIEGTVLLERGERLGRKLSATGNGQGNLTNLTADSAEYFSVSGGHHAAVKSAVEKYGSQDMQRFFASLGVPCSADERGRVYPASRQASSLTDALRFALEGKGVDVRTQSRVTDLKKQKEGFLLTVEGEAGSYSLLAERVVLCAGGKAAKNFGTDGSAYGLATGLGHTLTKLYPSLVQLKTDIAPIKGLKGIRVNGGVLRAYTPTRSLSAQGDIIFTDYGVSGDGVFRLSAFLAAEIPAGECRLELDFLPALSKEEIYRCLCAKRERYPQLPVSELLFGIVNNQLGRTILRLAVGDLHKAATLVKAFPLSVAGSLGFDYAQVTKGGIPLAEVDEGLESRLTAGLYFAGEILDVDGQCGGFNLQWAYSSARVVAETIAKEWGQVCD